MDQNAQFFITVGTVIAVFLWLRNDINRLDAKIDRVNDSLRSDFTVLRSEVSIMREQLAWLRVGWDTVMRTQMIICNNYWGH